MVVPVAAAAPDEAVLAGAEVLTLPVVCVVCDWLTCSDCCEEDFPVGQMIGFPGWMPPADVPISPAI